MANDTAAVAVGPDGAKALENMHSLLLEALRHREQEVVRYLGILVPAVGGFVWLIHSGTNTNAFAIGTLGVLLLLLLGAAFSLAIGYNYRYITLELAKLETVLGIIDAMLVGWPRSRQDFLDRYKIFCCIPWCTPPEMIKVFWWVFLVSIVGVTVAACLLKADAAVLLSVIPAGIVSLGIGLLLPLHFGRKLHEQCKKEPESWSPATKGAAATS